MSNSLRELSQWKSEKVPIISKYAEEHAALMSAIAGRGFLNLPGYAYSAENRLEFATKLNLSKLNFKILSETVERELRQSGIDYDSSYKTALMEWEMEKQGLMDAWAQELAGFKQDESASEEVLNQLAVEVGKRAIVLMEAKSAIDVQMEAYRLSLAQLDGSVAPYEVELANAKLLTAQKKLEIIPILTEILEKEQELLVLEQSKTAEYTTYINAEKAVSDKLNTITPFINALATKSEELATKIENVQIPKEEQIADEKLSQAEAIVAKSGFQIDELNANIETDEKQLEFAGAKRDLQTTQFDNEQELINKEINLTNTYQADVLADSKQGIQDDRERATYILDKKKTINDHKNTDKKTSATTIANAQMYLDNADAIYTTAGDLAIAETNATAKLTASLTHLLT